jgi:hypothetical protein
MVPVDLAVHKEISEKRSLFITHTHRVTTHLHTYCHTHTVTHTHTQSDTHTRIPPGFRNWNVKNNF